MIFHYMKKIDWKYLFCSDSLSEFLYRTKTETKLLWQRKTRGWDDTEAWNLCNVTAQFMWPRVERLREGKHGHPIVMYNEIDADLENPTEEETRQATELWDHILGEIAWMLKLRSKDDHVLIWDTYGERLTKADEYFKKYFWHLWD